MQSKTKKKQIFWIPGPPPPLHAPTLGRPLPGPPSCNNILLHSVWTRVICIEVVAGTGSTQILSLHSDSCEF